MKIGEKMRKNLPLVTLLTVWRMSPAMPKPRRSRLSEGGIPRDDVHDADDDGAFGTLAAFVLVTHGLYYHNSPSH